MKIQSIQCEPGKWYRLDTPELTECCDCSLLHWTEYKLSNGRIFWRSKVDRKATAAKRKENGIKIIRGSNGNES